MTDNAVSGRAILATKPGGPEVLELSSDYKARMPNKGEILVKMASTGINNLECLVRSGASHFRAEGYPCVLGADGAGEVFVAPEGSKFKKGDKVVFLTGNLIPKKGSVGGTYAEYCLVQESCAAVLTPEAERHLPLRDAGGLPVAALTALSVLDKLALKPAAGGAPQRVLLFGASGGVGQIAVQLAKARGLHVVGVCSAKHAAHVASLGADETFDYALGKDALAERFGATNDTKFDGILDLVGGDLPRFAARALLKRSGHLSILMTSSTSISYVAGYVLFSIFWLGPPTGVTILTNVDCGKKLEGILQQIGEGKLRMPQVAERLPPDRIAKAHEIASGHRAGGKVIIVW